MSDVVRQHKHCQPCPMHYHFGRQGEWYCNGLDESLYNIAHGKVVCPFDEAQLTAIRDALEGKGRLQCLGNGWKVVKSEAVICENPEFHKRASLAYENGYFEFDWEA